MRRRDLFQFCNQGWMKWTKVLKSLAGKFLELIDVPVKADAQVDCFIGDREDILLVFIKIFVGTTRKRMWFYRG